MAHEASVEGTSLPEEVNPPTTPGADYGLRNGFDPARYDFYNPVQRRWRDDVARGLDEQRSDLSQSNARISSSQPGSRETSTPPTLSPIEEQEDDLQTVSHGRRRKGSNIARDNRPVNATPRDLMSDRPGQHPRNAISVEKLSDLLFSRQHLQLVLEDPPMSTEFKKFVQTYRRASIPLLAHYINLTKALKSVCYAEAIMKGLEDINGHVPTEESSSIAMPWVIHGKIERTLDMLLVDDFRAFISHFYVNIVNGALADRVIGGRDSAIPGGADGLAEVFVLSDPARSDNPIVLTSEDFQDITGYTRKEFIGRNCRMLAGPKTSRLGIRRFRASLEAEREHCEVLLN
ncbi:MAG: hypothetical protein Q9217_003952 [Psora testacea]